MANSLSFVNFQEMRLFTFGVLSLFVLLALSSLGFAGIKVVTPSCPPQSHWVRPHFRKAYIRSDGVAVSATNILGHCRTNPPSYAIWMERLRAGTPPNWKSLVEKNRRWTEEEKERVLDALSSLPNEFLLLSVNGIYRLNKSQIFAKNPASGFSNYIVLYDQAFDSSQNLTRILAHEFAHKLYSQLSGDDARSYGYAADWRVTKTPRGEIVFIPMRDLYVEEDGKEGPDEDFSNNIEYYLFKPDLLRVKSPKVYEWIRQKYSDRLKIGKGAQK